MSGLSDPLQYKKYFGQFSGDFDNRREIETYDNFAAEYCGIKGVPLEYYPINVDSYKQGLDVVYGENSSPKWDRKYVLTAILEEWTQEIQAFGGFGMVNTDDITLYMHRSTFDKIVGIRSNLAPTTNPERRGSYGPVAKDEIRIIANGLVYEVLTGGEHFMESDAQHFGHKFWYKLTCKIRETSTAAIGVGEQRGALPEVIPMDPKYGGNPQFELLSPTQEELDADEEEVETIDPSGTPTQTDPPEYVTIGAAPGPGDGTVPDDIFLPDGRVAEKYKVKNEKEYSTSGDQKEIKSTANEVVDPQTSLITTPGTSGNIKYGPNGIVIPDRRFLWADW
jgi:hypothetical protein